MNITTDSDNGSELPTVPRAPPRKVNTNETLEDIMRKLNEREEKIRQLEAELESKNVEINELHGQIQWLRVGINQMQQPRTNRGIGLSAEPPMKNSKSYDDLIKHNSGTCQELIVNALQDNAFMRHLDSRQVEDIVRSMKPVNYHPCDIIMKQGEVGNEAFVLEAGKVEVIKDEVKITELGEGKVFGELAILYNCFRTATVRALTECRLWSISRQDYQSVMMYSGLRQHKRYVQFLQSVPGIKSLQPEFISKIADALDTQFFHDGEYIIRQGAIGRTFYILTYGEVRVTQTKPGSNEEELLCTYKSGQYFGERALETFSEEQACGTAAILIGLLVHPLQQLKLCEMEGKRSFYREEVRAANVIASHKNGVECLVLESNVYQQFIKGRGLYHVQTSSDPAITAKQSDEVLLADQLASVTLDDLEIKITLGIGGFGRTELVHLKSDEKKAFALKRMKKRYIVDMRQQEHVLQEKELLMQIKSPFIVKLYRTYKDAKYVYLLMEVCLGGELWTLLRNRHYFTEKEARFIVGCVIQAFSYLHARGIVYRDLKPENLMLDTQGYVKLVDFGFAKRIRHGGKKTWTFCGTPEYVAPEVILSKGHDFAADMWSLGILVFELLNGSPPFNGLEHLSTYNLILRGIDSIDFPKSVGKVAKSLVKKLCKDNPNDRLGYGSKGLENLLKHKWFDGFNWGALAERRLSPPIVPLVKSETDASNFDKYPADESATPDETSGWDNEF